MQRLGNRIVLRVLAIGLIATLGGGLLPTATEASHSWAGAHWARTANPFTVRLGDNVGSGYDKFLRGAAADWNASPVLNTPVVTGRSSTKCRPTAGRVEVCSGAYGATGWLGLANIWLIGTHITQGTVKMNNSYFGTAPYNTGAWRRLVMCQEIGHTLGLAHVDENKSNANLGTCMDYTNDPNGTIAEPDQLNNVRPNQHDYDELQTIYNHADSTTTATASTTQTAGQSTTVPADPSGPEKGGVADFARELGGGKRVITFVIWADANLIAAAHANAHAPVANANTATDHEAVPVPTPTATSGTPNRSDPTTGADTAPAPAPAEAATTAVTISETELRDAPSRRGTVVAVLPAGTSVTVTGPAGGRGAQWVPVTTGDGRTGYIEAPALPPQP